MEELFNHYMEVTIKPCVAKTEVSRFSSCFFILLFICFLSLFRSWTSPFLGSSKASFMRVKLLQETCEPRALWAGVVLRVLLSPFKLNPREKDALSAPRVCQSALEIELDAKIELCEDRATWKSGYLDIDHVAYWDNNCECVPQAVLRSMEIKFNSFMGEGDLSTLSINVDLTELERSGDQHSSSVCYGSRALSVKLGKMSGEGRIMTELRIEGDVGFIGLENGGRMEELFNHYMGVTIKPCVAKTEVSRRGPLLSLVAPRLLLYESKAVARNLWFVARAPLF
ncbi:hypothetical protein IGI04_007195 [Brassica rapa subsp. trilocularis]|uniref:Uncharacterized protein n=1 Tax=Brassica rapa subsp. trilocularis TaxID=1813537 RepID=A0ABQ7NKA5_BRACM|nr:hypothetical protein IGI04_007195 [Brassica rapa subsp. trilocularis]